jgi:endonuclease/exonuclease/phosphatase family metal-dependent hydrolase
MLSSPIRALLAVALVAPLLLPVSAKADEINFVSYNLKNYLDMDRRVDGEFKRGAPKPEREIEELIKMIAAVEPAILGVCEIGDADDFADLKRRLAAAGLDYPHTELTLAADETRHVAILSKFPIVDRNSQTSLTYKLGDAELPFQRGILDVTIQAAEGYRLRCLGIHLKSKREISSADQALMRRNEAELLRDHIDGILTTSPATNLIVYGDFNETRNELPIKVIKGRFGTPLALTDIQLADDRGDRWTYYWRWADQYSRFDFIFASKGLVPEILTDKSRIHTSPEWFTASDHRPLVVRIETTERDVK